MLKILSHLSSSFKASMKPKWPIIFFLPLHCSFVLNISIYIFYNILSYLFQDTLKNGQFIKRTLFGRLKAFFSTHCKYRNFLRVFICVVFLVYYKNQDAYINNFIITLVFVVLSTSITKYDGELYFLNIMSLSGALMFHEKNN